MVQVITRRSQCMITASVSPPKIFLTSLSSFAAQAIPPVNLAALVSALPVPARLSSNTAAPLLLAVKKALVQCLPYVYRSLIMRDNCKRELIIFAILKTITYNMLVTCNIVFFRTKERERYGTVF